MALRISTLWTSPVGSAAAIALLVFAPSAYATPGRLWPSAFGYDGETLASPLPILLLPSILLAVIMILFLRPHRGTREKPAFSVPLGLLFLAGMVSVLANPSPPAVVTWAAVSGSAGLVYLAFRRLPPGHRWTRLYLGCVFVAGAIPLTRGLVAFVAEWGIPDSSTLLFARYELDRMVGYQEATFGNTGNTAAFLLLLGLPAIAAALDSLLDRRLRRLAFAACALMAANLLIVQSRTAFIILALLVPVAAKRVRPNRKAVVAGGVVLSLMLLTVAGSITVFVDRIRTSAFVEAEEDDSVAGRLDAMAEAWAIFGDHPFAGVGPGNLLYEHSQTSAHQWNIQMASELGILGLLASLWLMAIVGLRFGRSLRDPLGRFEDHDQFLLLVGPAGFLAYGLLANMTMNVGLVNPWTVLLAAALGLADRPRDKSRPAPSDRAPAARVVV